MGQHQGVESLENTHLKMTQNKMKWNQKHQDVLKLDYFSIMILQSLKPNEALKDDQYIFLKADSGFILQALLLL